MQGYRPLATATLRPGMTAQHFLTDHKKLIKRSLFAVLMAASLCLPGKRSEAQVQINSTPVTSGVENVTYTYSLTATEANNDPVTFSATGLPAWLSLTYGQNSSTPVADISQCYGVASDADGNVYSTNGGATTIYKIAPDGTKTDWATKASGYSYGIAVDGNYLYIGYWLNYNCSGKSITRIALDNPAAGEETVLNSSTATAGMAMVFKDGYLYYPSYACNKIGRVNLTTLASEVYISTALPGSPYGPWGLGFAKNGDLYLASYNTTVIKYASGTTTNPVTVLSDLYTPTDIKIDNNGYIYISFAGYGIRKYTPDLSSYVTIASSGSIYSMALSPSGTLSYGDAGTDKVYKLATGAVLTGTPTHEDVGQYPVKVTASNGSQSTDQEFTITITDPNPPTVTTYSPVNGEVEVALDASLSLTFNETVQKGTGNIYIKSVADNSVLQTIDVTGSNVTISDKELSVPLSNLPTYTNVYVAIDAGAIMDVNGNAFAGISGAATWAFTTIQKLAQHIAFAASDAVEYGTADYAPAATSDAQLSLSFASSDESVASIVNGMIHIKKAGTVTITASQAGNDDYLPATSVEQTLTVTKKDITASLNTLPAISKPYDGNANATLVSDNYSLTGVVNDDEVSVTGTAAFSDPNAAADKTITVNGLVLSGAEKDNYNLTTTSATTTGTIQKKDITVTLNAGPAINKVYDGNSTATLQSSNYSLQGVIGDEDVTVTGTASYADKNAGDEKSVTVGSFVLGGADKANYRLTTETAEVNGSIAKKSMTITAADQTKVYGASDPQFTYQSTGMVQGDQLSGALARDAGKNVGQYTINIGSLTAGSNYTVSQFTPGHLTITPAQLVITAEDKTKEQGTANPSLTLKYDGLAGGDSPSDLTTPAQVTTGAATGSPIGYYDITVSGAASANYTISFVSGKLSILPAGNTHLKVWSSSNTTLQVRIYAEAPQHASISLYTQRGQPVIQQQQQLQAGISSSTMPIGNLAPGVYILHVRADKFKESQRVKIK